MDDSTKDTPVSFTAYYILLRACVEQSRMGYSPALFIFVHFSLFCGNVSPPLILRS